MIYRITDKKHTTYIKNLCSNKGKIYNQLILAKHSLPIPESIVISNLTEEDKKQISKFTLDPTKEYQVRSENIGSDLRYSESSTGLTNKNVLEEIQRINRKGGVILLQKIPYHSISRNIYGIQYCIHKNKLIIEIRAGNATNMVRCGWPLSEYYEIPLELINKQKKLNMPDFHHIQSRDTLLYNLYLDCVDRGYKKILKSLHRYNIFSFPENIKLGRIQKIYELKKDELKSNILNYVNNKNEFRKYTKKISLKIEEDIVDKWFIQFNISKKIAEMNLEDYLSFVGYCLALKSKDKCDSLKIRLMNYIEKDQVYQKLDNRHITMILNHTREIQHILLKKIAKLSIQQDEKNTFILYWDLIPWTK